MSDFKTAFSRRDFLSLIAAATGSQLVRPQAGQAIRSESPPLKLWYRQPASRWEEALPLGNGRLGAMVFGDIETARFQLNEDTLWSGMATEWDNPDALAQLPAMRRLIAAGDLEAADRLGKRMMGPYTQSYMPMGDLRLIFQHGQLASDYRRELDLGDAASHTSYRIGECSYSRTSFISHRHQALFIILEASEPESLNFVAQLGSKLWYTLGQVDSDLIMEGRAPDHVDPNYYQRHDPVRYEDEEAFRSTEFACRLKVQLEGGSSVTAGPGIRVRNATRATLILTAATSFMSPDVNPREGGRNPLSYASRDLQRIPEIPVSELMKQHVSDNQSVFHRCLLDLGSDEIDEIPTDERIRNHGSEDTHLVNLAFQYGRYLLLSSSRPGTQPANLQGIWNDHVRPPWSSNYTLNINAQMNYWAAETTNMAEFHLPLVEMIGQLAVSGAKTAATNYGAPGWVAHHNTDIWRQTAPVGDFGHGDSVWALWPMGGAWLCQHLWEHYDFGRDDVFLGEIAYPLMKGAAEFMLDWLITGPNGTLVTSPSTSPELRFVMPDGTRSSVSSGATMDLAIARDLFTNCIRASEILDLDDEFRQRLTEAVQKLHPYQVGSRGQLQEWIQDWEEEDPNHRHFSHLFGLHPGRHITRDATPDLFAAARRSLELRGDEATGWSLGWKINAWARLGDGDRSLRLIDLLLRPADDAAQSGGIYPNLFDAHPPFQIDGNFGLTAGVAEMLLQSHAGELNLLPALPSTWKEGSIIGLRARGGAEVDLYWTNGRLERVEVMPTVTASFSIRYGDRRTTRKLRLGDILVLDGRLEEV